MLLVLAVNAVELVRNAGHADTPINELAAPHGSGVAVPVVVLGVVLLARGVGAILLVEAVALVVAELGVSDVQDVRLVIARELNVMKCLVPLAGLVGGRVILPYEVAVAEGVLAELDAELTELMHEVDLLVAHSHILELRTESEGVIADRLERCGKAKRRERLTRACRSLSELLEALAEGKRRERRVARETPVGDLAPLRAVFKCQCFERLVIPEAVRAYIFEAAGDRDFFELLKILEAAVADGLKRLPVL